MKRTNSRRNSAISPIASGILISVCIIMTSCIFEDSLCDNFYHTLWESSEEPLYGLTIEFLCDGSVLARDDSAIGSFGKYEPYKMTATFTDLKLYYDDSIVIFEEGHIDNDLMRVAWHYSNSTVTRITLMHRSPEKKNIK